MWPRVAGVHAAKEKQGKAAPAEMSRVPKTAPAQPAELVVAAAAVVLIC